MILIAKGLGLQTSTNPRFAGTWDCNILILLSLIVLLLFIFHSLLKRIQSIPNSVAHITTMLPVVTATYGSLPAQIKTEIQKRCLSSMSYMTIMKLRTCHVHEGNVTFLLLVSCLNVREATLSPSLHIDLISSTASKTLLDLHEYMFNNTFILFAMIYF